MLQKYQHDPTRMQRISKHFYSEEVYDDSSDRPRLRWRFRNFFEENAAYPLVTDEHASNSEKYYQKRTISKNSDPKPKQAEVSLNLIFSLGNLRTDILRGKYRNSYKSLDTFYAWEKF